MKKRRSIGGHHGTSKGTGGVGYEDATTVKDKHKQIAIDAQKAKEKKNKQ